MKQLDRFFDKLGQLLKSKVGLWLGVGLVACYWFMIHPPAWNSLGYMEDFCSDIVRQLMAEKLTTSPVSLGTISGQIESSEALFTTQSFMYPFGASVPFMSWSFERDALGALVWLASPQFPFSWIYLGLSFLMSFIFIFKISKNLGKSLGFSSLFAALAVVFHIARHLKTYYHFEHLPLHALYLSLFLDAYIWLKLKQKNQWSHVLFLWRLVVLGLGFLGTGYYWGYLFLQFFILQGACLILLGARRYEARVQFLPLKKWAILFPIISLLFLAMIAWVWHRPLWQAAAPFGKVFQPVFWFADFSAVFEPLFSWIWGGTPERYETSVTVGWTLWGFLGLMVYRFIDKQTGQLLVRLRLVLELLSPWIVLFLVCFLYLQPWSSEIGQSPYHLWIQRFVPLLEFFRVASRMGLVFPVLIFSAAWILWVSDTKAVKHQKSGFVQVGWVVWVVIVVLESYWLFTPIKAMDSMPADLQSLLNQVKQGPGLAVLDLPFCVAGGNGYCTAEQCPQYPHSIIGQCFRMVHEKRVHGLYQARMTPKHCSIYDRAPYQTWMKAWKEDRCLSDQDWVGVCQYLQDHPAIGQVLVYPDQWKALQDTTCLSKLESHLGQPLGKAEYPVVAIPGRIETTEHLSKKGRVWLYSSKCKL